jgi:hypothetical protein
MSEGEHTIISKIPRERLNQIASRKLSALGVPVRLGADRETLEGELAFQSRLLHPATGEPIARARFVVEGHDGLRFVDPPLAALGAVELHAHERLASLEQALSAALARRAERLRHLAGRLRELNVEAGVDADRLAIRAVVKTPSHAFEILGDPRGVRLSRVAPVGGVPFEVAPELAPIDLGALRGPGDLERLLVAALGRMPSREPARTDAAAAASAIEATPPPRNAVTLAALARVFGEQAILAPAAAVELVQEFQHGGTRYRFVAAREAGTVFRGRLIGPGGDVWSERFELAEFPGTAQVVARALGAPGGDDRDAAACSPSAGAPGALEPRRGEVWVMNVVVEEAGDEEVRYVGTDIDGRPYGAARVLKRAEFEAVFTCEAGGWRLLVQLDQVQDGNVIYRQLDRQRQPIGAPRRMPSAILVANFVPEAAAR